EIDFKKLNYQEKCIMDSVDIDYLRDIIVNTIPLDQESYRKIQLAVARLELLHSAVLILTGFSEKKAEDATDAMIRKFMLYPNAFEYNVKATEDSHSFTIKSIPYETKIYIAKGKKIASAGRKLLQKRPERFALDVIQDTCR